VYDPDTGKGELRGGDVDWNNVFEVLNGRVPDLILGASEQKWLEACWESATSGR